MRINLVPLALICVINQKSALVLGFGGGGGTRVDFGWVCAAQASKFQKDFAFKVIPRS